MTKGQASAVFRDPEKEGLCHTVWTFVAPFIEESATVTVASVVHGIDRKEFMTILGRTHQAAAVEEPISCTKKKTRTISGQFTKKRF